MQSSEQGAEEKGRLEGDLTSTKHELLKIKDMLDMAEKVRAWWDRAGRGVRGWGTD